MLRYLERDGWDCDTACEKVVELVLALASTLEGDMERLGALYLLGRCDATIQLPKIKEYLGLA